jgi:hypothetical protein
MSELDRSALVNLATHRAKKDKPNWRPVDLATLHDGTYLAADPSLSGFGLVFFEVAQPHRAVHFSKTFAVGPQSAVKGWEDVLTRARMLQDRIAAYLAQWVFSTDWGVVHAVHESPPIGHGKLVSPEIALIASYAFRQAVGDLPVLPMVRRQDHAKLVCGNPNATKQNHHRAVRGLLPAITGGEEWITNESHRDALSVAITAAHRGVS